MQIGPGLSGGSMPRMRPGDFDAAWALIVACGADKSVKAYLAELQAAKLAHDEARDAAGVATAEAKRREEIAQEAEDRATQAEAKLSVETMNALKELARRELIVKELERVADERETTLRKRDTDIKRRTGLLLDAGVTFSE